MSAADYMTVEEIAAELRCNKRFVLDELRRKNMRGLKTGVGWRITPDDFRTYMDAHANVRPVGRAS